MRQTYNACADMLLPAMTPNLVSYNAFIGACEKGREMHRALDVCAAMLRQAMRSDMVSYSASLVPARRARRCVEHTTFVWTGCAKL